jgi:hypothetical protein
MSIELHGLSRNLSLGLLIRKAQVAIVENLLQNFELRRLSKHGRFLVSPKLYQVDLLARRNFQVKLENQFKAQKVAQSLSLRQL